MNARRCTLLLVTASSLVLASCAIKQPPFGADIMPESARAKIPGSWAGPHRSGEVVPNWIRNFGDPELNALVADAVERNPDLKAAAARVEASRAAVRIAASSLYPRIAMKGLGERQGQRLSGDLGRDINPPSFGGPGTEDSGGVWTRHEHGFNVTTLGIWACSRCRMGGRRVGTHSLEKSCREG